MFGLALCKREVVGSHEHNFGLIKEIDSRQKNRQFSQSKKRYEKLLLMLYFAEKFK
jgi:hypothetical protein